MALVPAPAGRNGPIVRQKPGKNDAGTAPPAAGAPKITKTTTTTSVPGGPSLACSADVASATAAITRMNSPHRTRNFDVGMAPRTGPAIVAVRSPPSTATPTSAAARQRGVAGPPNAIAIVADRYPPTTSAIVIKNGTIPVGSRVGSG